MAIFFIISVPGLLFYLIRKDIIKGQKSIVKRYQYYYIDGEFKKKYILKTLFLFRIFYWELIRVAEKLLIMGCYETLKDKVQLMC